MLCIIAGHFGIVSAERFVFTFHVPLFFLLSGYFLSTKVSFLPLRKLFSVRPISPLPERKSARRLNLRAPLSQPARVNGRAATTPSALSRPSTAPREVCEAG